VRAREERNADGNDDAEERSASTGPALVLVVAMTRLLTATFSDRGAETVTARSGRRVPARPLLAEVVDLGFVEHFGVDGRLAGDDPRKPREIGDIVTPLPDRIGLVRW
jgi:hypothetical protein